MLTTIKTTPSNLDKIKKFVFHKNENVYHIIEKQITIADRDLTLLFLTRVNKETIKVYTSVAIVETKDIENNNWRANSKTVAFIHDVKHTIKFGIHLGDCYYDEKTKDLFARLNSNTKKLFLKTLVDGVAEFKKTKKFYAIQLWGYEQEFENKDYPDFHLRVNENFDQEHINTRVPYTLSVDLFTVVDKKVKLNDFENASFVYPENTEIVATIREENNWDGYRWHWDKKYHCTTLFKSNESFSLSNMNKFDFDLKKLNEFLKSRYSQITYYKDNPEWKVEYGILTNQEVENLNVKPYLKYTFNHFKQLKNEFEELIEYLFDYIKERNEIPN